MGCECKGRTGDPNNPEPWVAGSITKWEKTSSPSRCGRLDVCANSGADNLVASLAGTLALSAVAESVQVEVSQARRHTNYIFTRF